MGGLSGIYGLVLYMYWLWAGICAGYQLAMDWLSDGYWFISFWCNDNCIYALNCILLVSLNMFLKNRPAILTPFCNECSLMYLCNVWAGVKRPLCIFVAVSEIAYTYSIGPSFGNRHFWLWIWGSITFWNYGHQSHTIAHHHTLLRYGSGWKHTQMHGHTYTTNY